MDRGARHAISNGVAKSQTRVNDEHFHFKYGKMQETGFIKFSSENI